MPIDNIIDELPSELRQRLERDAERARHMTGGGHLQDWLDYEVGLWGISNEAMRGTHTNQRAGRAYNERVGQLYEYYGLDRLDGGSVTAVLWLTDTTEKTKSGDDHLTRKEILNGILKSLTPGQRSRLTSPISARQRVSKKIAELIAAETAGDQPEPVNKGEKPLSILKQTEQKLAKALQENHHLKEQLKRGDQSLFDLKQTPPVEMAFVFTENVTEGRWREIKKAVDERYKLKKQKPAG